MPKESVPILSVAGLSFRYGDQPILSDLCFHLPVQGFTGIIGPNGSGKTTLLKCLNKALTPTQGRVIFTGQDLARLNIKALARLMGVVPQQWTTNFAFTVREIVMMGRFPYLKPLADVGKVDQAIVRDAMEATKTWAFADRLVTELSGGERQRVLIAQALAQTPRLLLLDEPTSHLDVNQTLEICELLTTLIKTKGLTVLAVFHDLNLAGRYCKSLILLKDGRIFAQGTPEEVLTVENLEAVFGVKAVVHEEPYTGKPYIFFFPKAEKETQDFLARNHTP